MKKTFLVKILFAALTGMASLALSSCSVDDSNGMEYMIDDKVVAASFNGKWFLDGQNMGNGKVDIDSMLTLFKLPLPQMLPALLDNNSVLENQTVDITADPLKIKVDYVGVSQTSRYYNMPATQVGFAFMAAGVAYDVRLQTARTGSVVLLQEGKNYLSVVLKITQTTLLRHDNGQVMADSRKEHTVMFESDFNK